MKKNSVLAKAFLIAILLLAGCAATQVTTSWKDPGYRKMPHKVLAVALIKNVKNRAAVEDEFARQLNGEDLTVTAGSKAFPERTPDDKKELEKYLRDNGYDSFLLVRIVAEKDLVVNANGPDESLPNSYDSADSASSSSDQIVRERITMTQANLYDVATQKLFWTAAIRTTIDKVNHDLIVDYVTQVLKRMHKDGLVR